METWALNGRTLQEAVESAAVNWPCNGFTFEGRGGAEVFYSFVEIERETASRAAGLAKLGLAKGERIVLSFTEPEDFVLTFLAAIRLGLWAVPVFPPPTLGDVASYLERINLIQAAAAARVLVTAEALAKRFQPLLDQETTLEAVVVASSLKMEPLTQYPPISPDDVAFLQFTSGTTREPRGVMVTHRMLVANSIGIMGAQGLQADPVRDKGVCWVPLYHDMGMVGFVAAPLFWGVSTVFIPTTRFLRNPSVWMDAIDRHRGTITWGPNFSYALAARKASPRELERWDLSCVKVLGCGGEPVNPQVVRNFNTIFCEATGLPADALRPGYGLAEGTLTTTLTPLAHGMKTVVADEEFFGQEGRFVPAVEGRRIVEHVSVGRVIAGHRICVVDDNCRVLPDGYEGEVLMAGPSVTPGYFRNPTATAAILADGWLRTGDLGFALDGELFITGRIKDLLVYNGHNVAPQLVEWSIARVDGVRDGSVVAFGTPGTETERIVVVIEIWGSEPDQIVARVKTQVQRDLLLPLADVVCVQRGTISKTSSGKLQRWRVRADYLNGTLAVMQRRERADADLIEEPTFRGSTA